MKPNILFSSYYFAPIEYYYQLTQYNAIYKDFHEHFIKQTYRNRCYILSPNGIQHLTIPLVNVQKKKATKDVKISYEENWQKIHWKSFEAAYRRSPFFEYYENEFYATFNRKEIFLIDFNEKLEEKIRHLIGLHIDIIETEVYTKSNNETDDYRSILSPKTTHSLLTYPDYIQVFSDRHDFKENLSIIDLLFNEGPNSLNYLKSITKS